MQAPKSPKPSAVTVRRAYKSPRLARFGALQEITLTVGKNGAMDNAGPGPSPPGANNKTS